MGQTPSPRDDDLLGDGFLLESFDLQVVQSVAGHKGMTVREYEGITHGVTVGTVSGKARAVPVGTV